MKIQQLSLYLENSPGRLLKAYEAMSSANINLFAGYLTEKDDYGFLRVLVKDFQKAFEALQNSKLAWSKSEVLAVQTPDVPGSLTSLLKLFAAKAPDLNIEYMYAFPSRKIKDNSVIVLSFADIDRALSILKEANVNLVGPDDLFA